MIGSLFTGISGLNANAKGMTVIGDNIANVNTPAFKANYSTFANILNQSLGGSGGNEIGRGVDFWGANPLWTQGSLETTSSATDLAISGRGFFMLNEPAGATYYSRAGAFNFDKEGYLVNPDGLIVQGYEVAPNGTLGIISDIVIPVGGSAPHATDEITITMNLSADAQDGDTYSTTIGVVDSLGSPVPVTLEFTYDNANSEWDWIASVPATVSADTATGSIAFDANGNLDPANCSPVNSNPALAFTNLLNGASDLSFDWVYLDNTNSTDGSVTGYANPSTTTFITQTGYPAGNLQSVSADEDGFISGAYSNGQVTPLFQIALADFPSLSGMSKMGRNLYGESLSSGQAMPGIPGNGRLGSISPSSLEMSNVDLASEFVKMITTQRAFQANSRVITTSDEILAELINLKR